MKQVVLILLMAVTIKMQAQIFKYEPSTESATFHAPDSMSVSESFKLVKKLVPNGLCAHHRYVIKDGKKYMRKYYVRNFLYRKTYLVEGNSLTNVH